jgi:hypothetical protein
MSFALIYSYNLICLLQIVEKYERAWQSLNLDEKFYESYISLKNCSRIDDFLSK